MQQRVFVHVGLPKSGTTFLQAVLAANKKQLQERDGLLYPGATWSQQVMAVRDLRQLGHPDRHRTVRGAWRRLVKEITSWPGNSVVSMEWLGGAKPKHVRRLVRDLRPARVEVVFTTRDLGRTIPGAWQESIQNQREWTWREFLDGVTADDPELTQAGRKFWALHDIGRMLSIWGEQVPVQQMHVVTVPKAGSAPSVLWERFCQVLGIEASGYVLDKLRSNTSLDVASTEVIRRLNALSREAELPREVHRRVLTTGMAKRGLAVRATQETRLTLPSDVHDWVGRRARQQIDEIQVSGVPLVGDLEELKPTLPGDVGPQPEDMNDGVLLEVALEALLILAQQSEARRAEVLARYERRLKRMNLKGAKASSRGVKRAAGVVLSGQERKRADRETGSRR